MEYHPTSEKSKEQTRGFWKDGKSLFCMVVSSPSENGVSPADLSLWKPWPVRSLGSPTGTWFLTVLSNKSHPITFVCLEVRAGFHIPISISHWPPKCICGILPVILGHKTYGVESSTSLLAAKSHLLVLVTYGCDKVPDSRVASWRNSWANNCRVYTVHYDREGKAEEAEGGQSHYIQLGSRKKLILVFTLLSLFDSVQMLGAWKFIADI